MRSRTAVTARLGKLAVALLGLAACGTPEPELRAALRLVAPLTAAEVKSYRVLIVPAKDRRGRAVTCEAFFFNDIPADSVPIYAEGLYPLDPAVSESFVHELSDVPSTAGKLLVWVEAYGQPVGEGDIVARGCTADVVVKAKSTSAVRVCLYGVPLDPSSPPGSCP